MANGSSANTMLRERTTATPPGRVLAVLLTATFMGQFDFFVVNVAAPSLQRDLGAGDAALEMIVGGYAFAYAAGLITGGRLGDLLGYRRMFVGGMTAFAATSLLCGLAASPGELIAARLGQGLAAAAMLPQVLALITATYPAPARPRALGWYGAAAGLGSIAGQVLGGVLVSSNVGGSGWRLIFLVNVPIGAVAAVLAWRTLPRPDTGKRPRLDPLGAVGVALTLGLVLVPLTLGRNSGWPTWTWISLAAAVPAAAVTLRWQQLLGRRGGAPVLDVTLLREKVFRAGLLANGAFMLYFASFMFTLTLLLQAGLGLGPFAAGMAFAPSGVAFTVTALAAQRLVARHGLRVVLAGCLISAAGLALLLGEVHASGPAASVGWVVFAAAVVCFGNGLVVPSLIGAALVRVAPRQAGAAAGVLSTAQQFASSAGVALIGTAFFAAVHPHSGPAGFTHGMVWAGALDVILVLVVATSIRLVSSAR